MTEEDAEAGRPAGRLHAAGRRPGAVPVQSCSTATRRPGARRPDLGAVANAPQNDVLALVNVTAARGGRRPSAARFTASGVANSFEATVPWEIRQGDKVVKRASPPPRAGWTSSTRGRPRSTSPAWRPGDLHVRRDDRRPVRRRGRRTDRGHQDDHRRDVSARGVRLTACALSRRQLNRTLLHRQHLLERRRVAVPRWRGTWSGCRRRRTCRRTSRLPARLTTFDPYDVTRGARGADAGPAADDARHHPPAHGRRRAHAAAVDPAACTSRRSGSARTSGRAAEVDREAFRPPSRHGAGRRAAARRRRSAWRWPSGSPTTPPPLGQLARSTSPAGPAAAARHLEGSRAAWSTSYVDRWLGAVRWSSPTAGDRAPLPARLRPGHRRRRDGLVRRHRAGAGAKAMDDLVRHEDEDGRVLYDVPEGRARRRGRARAGAAARHLRQRLALPRRPRPGDRRPRSASAGWARTAARRARSSSTAGSRGCGGPTTAGSSRRAVPRRSPGPSRPSSTRRSRGSRRCSPADVTATGRRAHA